MTTETNTTTQSTSKPAAKATRKPATKSTAKPAAKTAAKTTAAKSNGKAAKPKTPAAKTTTSKTAAKTTAARPLPSERKSMATPSKPKTETPAFKLPDGVSHHELLVEYLTEKVTTDENAAGKQLPWITAKGKAHVHARWLQTWLTKRVGVECPIKVASDIMREAGFKHRSLPVKGAKTTRMALWVGDAPRGTGNLARMPAPAKATPAKAATATK